MNGRRGGGGRMKHIYRDGRDTDKHLTVIHTGQNIWISSVKRKLHIRNLPLSVSSVKAVKTHLIICPRSEFFIVQGKIRRNEIKCCNSCLKKNSVSEVWKRKSCILVLKCSVWNLKGGTNPRGEKSTPYFYQYFPKPHKIEKMPMSESPQLANGTKW